MKTACLLFLILSIAALPLAAQELNGPGGSLTSNGVNPDPNCPFLAPGAYTMEIGGTPSVPYILAQGTYGAGTAFIGTESIDLAFTTAPVFVWADGLAGSAGIPQPFAFTNGAGQASWSIPIPDAFQGTTSAFQAIVSDPALPPFNLNTTAAAHFFVSAAFPQPQNSNLIVTGDDIVMTYSFAGGPYTFYGQTWTECHVSTNGWIVFGTAPTSSDLSDSATDFVNGAVGLFGGTGRPAIAMMWEDLDMGNRPGQGVYINEDAVNNVVTFTWFDGDFFSSTAFGSIRCKLSDNGGLPTVDFDFGGYVENNGTPGTNGPIVGISDGNIAQAMGVPAGADVQADIAPGCRTAPVTPYVGAGDFETYFQAFDGLGTTPAEFLDIGQMQYQDITGSGFWIVN